MKRMSWILLLVVACSSGPSEPEQARYSLVVVSGDGQEATVTETLAEALEFRLRDQNGEPKSGVRVVFHLSEGEGVFHPAEALTNSSGDVSCLFTLGTLAGSIVIEPELPDLEDLESVQSLSASALPDVAVRLAWVEGDGQKDAPGALLEEALAVEAQDTWGNAVTGIVVELGASENSSVSPVQITTAEGVTAECAWTLGEEFGVYELLATASGLSGATARAVADLPPVITGINYDVPADEGDPIVLHGEHFCETPGFNTLLLDDLPMEVVEADGNTLSALVPVGAPLGVHELNLRVGSQTAPEHPEVEVSLALGRVRDYPIDGGSTDIPLSAFNESTRYLAISYDLRAVAPYDYDSISAGAAGPPLIPEALSGGLEDFHRRMLQVRGEGGPGEVRLATDDRDTRDFNVFADYFGSTTDPAAYVQLSATRRYQGDHIQLYVDDRDLDRLPLARCTELGQTFENQIYETDRQAFGNESDYDGNGRVRVLLTRQVNLLTGQIDDNPTWGGEYVGGYFNPVDLPIWSWPAGTSNSGEIFYGIVPDPLGEFSKVEHTEEGAIAALKPILAHEFQHMINFFQRHAVLGGGSHLIPMEDLWLNEGLSHLAEDLCGFDEHNIDRVKLYLHSGQHRLFALASLEGLPDGQAVGNRLGERGASYLFTRYLADRWPGSPMDLVKSIVSGRDNVTRATGESYEQVFKDWLATLVLDDSGLSDDLRYEYTSLNVRTDFPYDGGVEEPFAIPVRDLSAVAWNSALMPGSFDLLELRGPAPGGVMDLRFSAEDASQMGILLIRTGL